MSRLELSKTGGRMSYIVYLVPSGQCVYIATECSQDKCNVR